MLRYLSLLTLGTLLCLPAVAARNTNDQVRVEGRGDDGKPTSRVATYDLTRFPVYHEGYFGFRMVGTHHIYTNFQVFSLDPDGKHEVE